MAGAESIKSKSKSKSSSSSSSPKSSSPRHKKKNNNVFRRSQQHIFVFALSLTVISFVSIRYAFRDVACIQEVVISSLSSSSVGEEGEQEQDKSNHDHPTTTMTTSTTRTAMTKRKTQEQQTLLQNSAPQSLSDVMDLPTIIKRTSAVSSLPIQSTLLNNQTNPYSTLSSSSSSSFFNKISQQPPWTTTTTTMIQEDNNNIITPKFYLLEDVHSLLHSYGSLSYPQDRKIAKQLSKQMFKFLCNPFNTTYTPPKIEYQERTLKNGTTVFRKVHRATGITSAKTKKKCTGAVQIVKCINCDDGGDWYVALSNQLGVVTARMNLTDPTRISSMQFHFFPPLVANTTTTTTTRSKTSTSTTATKQSSPPPPIEQIDVFVPVRGQDQKMLYFTTKLNQAVIQYHKVYPNVRVRLLVTRYPNEATTSFYTSMNNRAFGKTTITFINVTEPVYNYTLNNNDDDFVPYDEDDDDNAYYYIGDENDSDNENNGDNNDNNNNDDDDNNVDDSNENKKNTNFTVPPESFYRAHGINALRDHSCHDASCIVTVLDPNVEVNTTFFMRAMTYVVPGQSAYFPIMFHHYNPTIVELVEKFKSPSPVYRFDPHRGTWNEQSFENFALSGVDAKRWLLSENFYDNNNNNNNVEFYVRLASELNIVRSKDYGLLHTWNTINCQKGHSNASKRNFSPCLSSTAMVEGSSLGLYLRDLRQADPERFDELIDAWR